jgi:nucleoid DNA-binding protein
MIHFEDALVELLLQNNCVIVPGFGGFVAKTSSAKLNMETGTIQPPGKSILFNKQLTTNDGLLVNYICQQTKISFNESSDFVNAQVQHWNTQMTNGERVELDKIGFLFLDSENNIRFEQDRYTNLLLNSYGLEAIHFIGEQELNIIQNKKQNTLSEPTFKKSEIAFNPSDIVIEKVEGNNKDSIQIKQESTIRRMPAWKYVAAAALLPFAFYSYWIPMKTTVLESGLISFKDFDPRYSSQEGQYKNIKFILNRDKTGDILTIDDMLQKLPKQVDVYYYQFDDDLYVPVKLHKEEIKTERPLIDETIEEMTKPIVIAKPAEKPSTPHQFVVGCFSNLENANELVEKLKTEGFDARIAGNTPTGMTRVSAGFVPTEEQATALKSKAASKGYQGWVLK